MVAASGHKDLQRLSSVAFGTCNAVELYWKVSVWSVHGTSTQDGVLLQVYLADYLSFVYGEMRPREGPDYGEALNTARKH